MSELTTRWHTIRTELGTIISQLDGKFEKLEAEEKRMEQKRNESYLKGTEDMRKAVNMLYDARNIGLTPQKMEDLFGTYYIPSALSRFAAIDIIDGLKLFLKEKQEETEFKVGDEVELLNTDREMYKKYVVIKAEPDSNVIWLLNLKSFYRIWFDKDNIADLKKTGKHFDTIDIPEGGVTI